MSERGVLLFGNHAAQAFEHMPFDFGYVGGENLPGPFKIPAGDSLKDIPVGCVHSVHEIDKEDAAPVFQVEQVEKVLEDFLLDGAARQGCQRQPRPA